MKIEAVLWDVDSTLLDPCIPEQNAIRKCFEDFGFGECTDEMLAAYPPINIKWWDRILTEGKTKEEITVGRFSEFLALFGLDDSKAEKFNLDYMNRLGDTVCPTPNAMETLTNLKGKVKQYIATNGLFLPQNKKVVNSGIVSLVDGVYISEEVGSDKPSKEFFDVIIEKSGVNDRSKIIMVGDSLKNDIQGANNCGIVSCWYNPNHLTNTENVKVDIEIDNISQVLDYVL